MLAILSPNRVISRQAFAILAAGELALLLLLWWAAPASVLPGPGEVASAFGRLWLQEGLGRELWTSFVLNLEALGWTVLISLGLAYLTVLPAARPIVAAISKGRFLGFVGLTFVFTLMVPGGRPLKIAMLVFGMTVFFVTSMADVVAAIPKERFDLARTLRMGEWRTTWEVVVLGTADQAIEVLRQNAAIGWMMLTMVEGIVRSEGGIGVLLLNQNKHLLLAGVFAIQFAILAVGLAQDYGIGLLKRLLFPYSQFGLEER